LIESREHRVAFLRVVAAGLQSAGEVLPAFEAYLQLIDADASPALDTIDEALIVDRTRWIRTQLEALRAMASPQDRAQIDETVAARLKSLLAAETPATTAMLRDFVATFGGIPAATAARSALVDRLNADHLIECEALVRQIDQVSPSESVAAHGHVARLLDEAGRPDLAAIYYDRLGGPLADVAGPDGKTGRQLLAELPDSHPVRKWLAGPKTWPTGNVTARESSVPVRATTQRTPRSVDLEIVGPGSPFFRDLTISLDLQTQVLVGQDGLGSRQFRIPINEHRGRRSPMSRFNVYNTPPLSYVSAHGGLLVLSMSNQLIAVDAMRGGEHAPNRILWTEDLSDQIGGFQTSQGVYSRPVAVPWGGTRYVPEDTVGRRYGSIGPVHDDGVYFQRLRDLHCVDPLSGKPLWTRKNVGLGNQLFGDAELLFVAPPGDEDTLVLRAATGEKAGTRRVVPFEQRMLTVGRNVMSWEPQGPQHLLAMRDPWEDKLLWSFAFAAGAKAAIVGEEAVGVLEPGGQFTLITIADGKPLVQEKLEPESSLLGIHLLAAEDQYLLVTNASAPVQPGMNVQPVAGASNYPMVNGRLYAFHRTTGAKSWPAPTVIAQYGLVSNQPRRLPLLVLVRQVQLQRGSGRREPKTSVLCIDKRTGRVAYANDELPATMIGNLELAGDAERHTVTLSLPPKVLEFTLTDDPPMEAKTD
jgi:outer membrane protein assembly factor BamB